MNHKETEAQLLEQCELDEPMALCANCAERAERKYQWKRERAERRAGLVMELVKAELKKATAKFGPFPTPHHGVAALEEEFLELQRAVFWGKGDPVEEATQVAAMAIRFLVDCAEL